MGDPVEAFFGIVCSLVAGLIVVVLPIWTTLGARRTRARVTALEGEVGLLRLELDRLRAERRAAPVGEAPVVAVAERDVAQTVASEPAGAGRGAVPERVAAEAGPVVAATEHAAAGPPASGAERPSSPALEATAPPSGGRPAVPQAAWSPERVGQYVLAGVGGGAAVLAALFGLREAVAAGLLGPGARFALACLVGATAWGVSEALRVRRHAVPANALAGVGAGVFYAALWAGHARYGLLSSGPAMAGMAAVTVVTLVSAERRNSPFMALLAAAGGYATPLLLSTGENRAVAFFAYLALLNAGVLAASARRGWWAVTGAAALATGVLYTGWAFTYRAPDQAYVGLAAPLILGAAFLCAGAIAQRPAATRSGGPPGAFGVVAVLGAALLWLAGAVFLIPADPLRTDPLSGSPLGWTLGATGWVGVAYIVAVALAAGGVARRGGVAAVLTGGFVALLAAVHMCGWALAQSVFSADGGWGPALATFVLVPVALGIGAPSVGARCRWVQGALAAAPTGVVVAALLAGLAALLGVAADAPAVSLAWAGVALGGLGAVVAMRRAGAHGGRWLLLPALVAAAAPLHGPLAAGPAGRWFAGAPMDALPSAANAPLYFLAAAVGYVTFAYGAGLRPRRGDLGGALAVALAGVAFFLPLRAVWLARLGPDALGLLAVLLGAGALVGAVGVVRATRARDDDRETAVLVAAALLFAAIAVPMQVDRHWLTLGWAIEVALLARVTSRVRHTLLPWLAAVLALLSFGRLVLLPGSWTWGGDAGPVVFNWTLYTFGVPVAAWLFAASWLRTGPRWLPTALRVCATVAGFALVNAEIAHAFAHDGRLSFSSDQLGESMTRSIAWAGYGLLLIGIGTWRDRRAARLAGLGVALLGAGKVFVVDLWSLEGLARVGSLAGLALTLLVGAVAFSRIVLRERK